MAKPTHLMTLSAAQRKKEFAQLQVELLTNNFRASPDAVANLKVASEALFDAIERVYGYFPPDATSYASMAVLLAVQHVKPQDFGCGLLSLSVPNDEQKSLAHLQLEDELVPIFANVFGLDDEATGQVSKIVDDYGQIDAE